MDVPDKISQLRRRFAQDVTGNRVRPRLDWNKDRGATAPAADNPRRPRGTVHSCSWSPVSWTSPTKATWNRSKRSGICTSCSDPRTRPPAAGPNYAKKSGPVSRRRHLAQPRLRQGRRGGHPQLLARAPPFRSMRSPPWPNQRRPAGRPA